ncbi:hypothetical protein FD30_GL000395 [Levilactobacillus namurensis DSM 19117]|uniref:Uncharacterized protein n=1 Tax=Levilactobacillus namurensis DSM 19117 TaxID=1423773 RepID=A0A0R1JQ52_9LACO|nr:hypothetical protein [Levilactobacillus namurensis]KRK73557.1 hypothetical protein FD30_GL000395 [Levilactobacillus namurensis DSM 19117]GEO74974.1 hypothetical protein LNA02_16720 [Levilactobacillus namurensis]
MPQPKKADHFYKPGPEVHPKKDSVSGGLADWGPLMALFSTGFKKLWHLIKKSPNAH